MPVVPYSSAMPHARSRAPRGRSVSDMAHTNKYNLKHDTFRLIIHSEMFWSGRSTNSSGWNYTIPFDAFAASHGPSGEEERKKDQP